LPRSPLSPYPRPSRPPPAPPPVPTRRSSDLIPPSIVARTPITSDLTTGKESSLLCCQVLTGRLVRIRDADAWHVELSPPVSDRRSEEHTSELQSRFDLVCRPLLGNKKLPLAR